MLLHFVVLGEVSAQAEALVFDEFAYAAFPPPRGALYSDDSVAPNCPRDSAVTLLRFLRFLAVSSLLALPFYLLLSPLVHGNMAVMLLLYVTCRLQEPRAVMALPFDLNVRARYFPFGMMAINVLMGRGVATDIVAVLIGHFFVYTLKMRRTEYLSVGLSLYDPPRSWFRLVKRLRMRRLEKMRERGKYL
jgi:hypothetical protein